MPQRLIALTVSVWLVAGVPAVAHAQVPDFEPSDRRVLARSVI